MATISQKRGVSSDRRPIALRLRSDLTFSESRYQGETSWVAKDPVSLKYFQLRRPEYFACQLLDGKTSAAEMRDALETEFPELSINTETVHLLVNSLHRNGLLVSELPGQAEPLRKRHHRELKQKAVQLLMSAMSIRFPGIDPEPFLNWLYPKVRFLFSRPTNIALVLLVCSAALLLLTNLDEFYTRLPEFDQFFDVQNILFMGAIMIVTKSIHELGHGLTCKHYGGECHEIGFMLLVLTPAMYCNTSDSWLLPNKWQRISIGAAGMYVETVVAAIATFLWWYTNPGWLHYLALNTIFLCSVSTIVFNLNPLLRYDGYYMLSDFLEIPNLAQKSRTAMINALRVCCLGMKPVQHRSLPKRRRWAFAVYSVASLFYRWFVMLLIFWFLIKIFEPYGLTTIAWLLIAVSLTGMVGIPLFKAAKFFLYPGRLREVRSFRFALSAAIAIGAGWFLFSIPVPRHVVASFVAEPIDADRIFVLESGNLEELIKEPGDSVAKGETIAILKNDDLILEAKKINGAIAQEKANIASLNLASRKSVQVSQQLAQASIRLAELRRQKELQSEKKLRLSLVSGRSGVVIPPPNVPRIAMENNNHRLPTWSGSPLDSENRNAFLETSTLFCVVGDPDRLHAKLIVNQSDVKLVSIGQKVKLMFDELPGKRFEGIVEGVSQDRIEVLPRELSRTNGGHVAAKPNVDKSESPLLNSYEVSVSLKSNQLVLTGFRGTAKIEVSQLPLGQQLRRYLQTVVNFR